MHKYDCIIALLHFVATLTTFFQSGLKNSQTQQKLQLLLVEIVLSMSRYKEQVPAQCTWARLERMSRSFCWCPSGSGTLLVICYLHTDCNIVYVCILPYTTFIA